MSIGKYLLTKERLSLVGKKSWKFGRAEILNQGMAYYDNHPQDVQVIVDNLNFMELPSSGTALDTVLQQMVIHYYEKLFVLTKTYEAYWIAKNRIEMGDSLDVFEEAKETGKAVFIGQSHFGATYFMGLALMIHGLDINVVGKFPEPAGSMMRDHTKIIVDRWNVGNANIINLAEEGVDVPMEMMRLLLTKKIISNVYDENNQFSKPVTLLGKKLMGGTGMDLILRNFNDEKVIAITPFLIRTSDETFKYELDRHELRGDDIIASFYKSLEERVRNHFDQWYFIHELHHSMG